MKKEVLLYGPIYTYSAADFINQMEAAKNDAVDVRINTPGGDVLAAYGMIAKLQEHQGAVNIKVDGMAASAGAFLCCYADNVECLDVSSFLFHRAAYPSFIESNKDLFTPDLQAALAKTNSELRAAMESKMRATDFEKVAGTSLDDMFSMEGRKDVKLSAQQALKLGLVKKVNSITPEQKAEIESRFMTIAASAGGYATPQTSLQKPKNKMTLSELKAAHPEAYAEAVGVGVKQERDRVGAFMVFAAIDPEGVAKGIKEGTEMSATQTAEFALKATSKQGLANIKADNAQEVKPAEVKPEATSDAEEIEAFNKSVLANLKGR